MNHFLAASSHGSSAAGPVVWITLLGGAAIVLYFFGWRPRRARSVRDSAAGTTARAVGRTVKRARGGKAPAPEDVV